MTVRERTDMVGADLQSLIPTHNKSDFATLLVLEQSDVTGTTLLPLSSVLVESEKLRSPVIQLH